MSGTKEIYLKPQEILFEEGDQSKNIYFLKSGIIRIFKRKAEGNIEIETIRHGQIIGELAFFDGLPRSASAEALTTTELIEISHSALDEAFAKVPEWLVSLTRTISSRLRNSNNRVRILEKLNTEYETDKHGNRSREYVYVSIAELLRFSTALLTVASRYGKNATAEGIEFNQQLLDKFATQTLQIPASKVVSLTELFKSVEILKGDLFLTDIRFLDQFIQFVSDQNLLEESKQQLLTPGSFAALALLMQNRSKAAAHPGSTAMTVNIGPALKGTKVQPAQLQELLDQHFVQKISIVSADQINVEFDGAKDIFLFRTFRIYNAIDLMNEQQRKA